LYLLKNTTLKEVIAARTVASIARMGSKKRKVELLNRSPIFNLQLSIFSKQVAIFVIGLI